MKKPTNFNVIAPGRNICHIRSSCWWRSRRAVPSKTRLVASCVRASLDRHLFDCISIPERGAAVLRHRSQWQVWLVFFGRAAPQKIIRKEKKNLLPPSFLLLLLCASPSPGSARDLRFAPCTDFLPQIYYFSVFGLVSFLPFLDPAERCCCSWKAIRTERVSTGVFLSPPPPPQQIMLPKLHHQRRN